ncbi:SDR family oxidoreductase [Comamonas testosteroni]|uniref:SDR family oxidoreductase n=1 Tax=Comamonas testosteroni TaxID=285 RepID=A0A373FF81_COMTE|nr:SDR family oxidoreductase [Comamonas testosteroni]RGE42105.1 SDR family oxidoreductase [Comamonas testosteroni]
MDRKVVLITGGSRGIGAATAVLAARKGWNVLISYQHQRAAADAVVNQCQQLGAQALAVQADMAEEAQILKLYAALDQQFGRLDALVNNAGVVDTAQTLAEFSMQRLERMFRINTIAAFVCAREAVLRMSTARGGHGGAIVNVSSIAARLGAPRQYVDYAASKGAVDVMTLGLAKEVAAEGIRVNAVRPGLIETDIHASGGQPDRVQRLAPNVPMQRGGTAEEVADAIVWLMSDGSRYTTGSLIEISGGNL